MSKKLEFINIENKDFINQYFYRYKILENEFENFKNILINYIKDMNKRENENEDSLVANCLSPFFNKLNFETHIKYKMKGKSEIDLAILKDSDIQVIIEAKKPNDKDFFYAENPNCKALHEAILYYFRIREESNSTIKYIILTDFYKFYIFEAKEFENGFYKNKDFEKLYKSFTNKNSIFDGRTEEFYLEAKKILDLKNFALKGAFIDLNEIIKTDAEYDFKNLKPYFKIFNRDFLLQEFNPNDANQLNKGFYDELLYLLGLCEKVINGKTLIAPSKNSIDKEGTLYYNILQHLPEYKRDKKENSENEIDENALEILIIWINRILFLKLLESSLINFNDDKNLAFLNIDKIQNYNKLNELFFKILAKKPNDNDRKQNNIKDLAYLPYLNSSLFTRSNKEIIEISQLSNLQLEYFKNTQIKDKSGKAKKGKEDWLKMIFEFLNSFDFGANYDNENLLAQKDLINSSVLGLVFEKLNGYKEGSFYTPSFITSYMCKESLDRIVLQKFSENGLNAENLDILQKQILVNVNVNFNFRDKAINILEEIRICDPAVGSGHFLVSALNEMIYIYYKLGLINISVSDLKIENDEILIKDREGGNFEYKRPKSQNDNHKIQMEIFNLKKSIIENNLFGVDINSNSCEITKLRLWIELLKNSYYLSFDSENYHNLQTLPNIDINIKCGNSLISNIDFGISKDNFLSNLKSRIDKADMFERETLKKEFDDIKKELPQRFENAKVQAKIYKNANDKTEAKKSKDIYEESILYLIKLFKRTCNEYINFYQGLHDFFYNYGYININNISNEQIKAKLKNYIEYFKFHEFVSFEKKIIREVKEKELSKIKTLMQAYEDFENKKTFEWRFEFPEVLDYEGNFKGFDLIIGNPPYIGEKGNKDKFIPIKNSSLKDFYQGKMDIFYFFFHLGLNLLHENGILSFITTNYYPTASGAKKLREDLKNRSQIISLINFGLLKIFDSAQGQHNMITTLYKSKVNQPTKIYNFIIREHSISLQKFIKSHGITTLQECLNSKEITNFYKSDNVYEGNEYYIRLSKNTENTELDKIFRKISGNGKYKLLGQICNINQGIVSGADKVTDAHLRKYDWEKYGINKGDGIYALTQEEVKAHNLEKSYIKPFYKNSDIHKYHTELNSKNQILYITGNEAKNDIPNILSHLSRFKQNLQERREVHNGSREWFALWWARKQEIFEGAKIVAPQRSNTNTFGYNECEWYASADVYFITPLDKDFNLKYILALLNSKLYYFWLYHKGKRKGENLELYQIPLSEIPIKDISLKEQEVFINLVDRIIEGKKNGIDMRELEEEVDRLVYELYELSEEEIKIIEGKD